MGFGSLGTDLTVANVNGDKYADVIAGAPDNGGAVAVLYGGKNGLSAGRRTVVNQKTKGHPGTATDFDGLGTAVAAADVNGDGYADAIVGAPQEFDGRNGVVFVLRGSRRGVTVRHAQRITAGLLGDPGDGTSSFGNAIVAFHPRGARYASVAIGAPGYEPSVTAYGRGFVDVYPGSRDGLTRHGAARVTNTVDGDYFGLALGL